MCRSSCYVVVMVVVWHPGQQKEERRRRFASHIGLSCVCVGWFVSVTNMMMSKCRKSCENAGTMGDAYPCCCRPHMHIVCCLALREPYREKERERVASNVEHVHAGHRECAVVRWARGERQKGLYVNPQSKRYRNARASEYKHTHPTNAMRCRRPH